VHSCPQEPKPCVRICCKECTDRNSTKCRSDSLRSQRSRRRESSEGDSAFQKCRRGPRDGFVGGTKVEAFEYLENILSRRKLEAQEEERQWSLDHSSEDQQPSDQSKVHEP
jgi:hypothetical protein